MKLLFVMDPLARLQIAGDTTFAIMLAAQARGPEITGADLEFTRRPSAAAPALGTTAPARATDGARPLGERLHEQERAAIVAAIDAAQGNIAHAARALGINRSTLYYRLRKHGLEHLLPTKPAETEGVPA